MEQFNNFFMTPIMHKIIQSFEPAFIALSIHWQPLFGIVMSSFGTVYYIGMIKTNIVDKKYSGSWKEFFKSLFKIK